MDFKMWKLLNDEETFFFVAADRAPLPYQHRQMPKHFWRGGVARAQTDTE